MQLRIGRLYLDGYGSKVKIIDFYSLSPHIYLGSYMSGLDVDGHNYDTTPYENRWVFNEDGTLLGVYHPNFNLISEVEVKPRIYKRSR